MRVLVVEDERDLAEAIARGLRRDRMAVDVAHDGAVALEKAEVNAYDVILLDRNLPAVHGDDVCRELRRAGIESRVLMLTASTSVGDRVEGLDLDADDYLGKPFEFAELLARVRALGRRTGAATPPVLTRAGIELDGARKTVTREGRPIELPARQFAVLEALMRADGAVVSAEQLLEQVWDEGIDPFSNVVRVTVMHLRKRLGDPPVIETVIRAGYRL